MGVVVRRDIDFLYFFAAGLLLFVQMFFVLVPVLFCF